MVTTQWYTAFLLGHRATSSTLTHAHGSRQPLLGWLVDHCSVTVRWSGDLACTADQEGTNTPLSVLPRRPLEVLLTSLWCSAESSEQSVVPRLTCTTPPSCRVHCWCVWTVAHSGVQCSPACMHSSHWSHQHSMTATRRAATRLRLDWTEAGPTLPHSTWYMYKRLSAPLPQTHMQLVHKTAAS